MNGYIWHMIQYVYDACCGRGGTFCPKYCLDDKDPYPLQGPKILPYTISKFFYPQNGFPVVKALIEYRGNIILVFRKNCVLSGHGFVHRIALSVYLKPGFG